MVASILLNILLVGVIIGDASHKMSRRAPFTSLEEELSARLPEDRKAVVEKTIKSVSSESRELRKQIKDSREKALSALTDPEFDEASFEKEIKQLHDLRLLKMRRMADATKELAGQLNQEERRILAKTLGHRPPRRE